MSKAWDIRAYTYNADMHCVRCAEQRFSAETLRKDTARDNEGNSAHPVFASDEAPPCGEYCGTCGDVLAEPYGNGEPW